MSRSVAAHPPIELRGVAVHNLRDIDLDLPRDQLVVVCGVSGSGKTSLALDTLYAEGQRRYVESFSAYMRQYLEQLDKPAADRISGIPAAIAVSRGNGATSSRSTVGTATEVIDYLRLLFARVATCRCSQCQRPVECDSADSVASWVLGHPSGRRFQVAAPLDPKSPWPDRPEDGNDREQAADVAAVAEGDDGREERAWQQRLEQLQRDGFVRIVAAGVTWLLPEAPSWHAVKESGEVPLIIIDRLVTGSLTEERLRDSIETALRTGGQRCAIVMQPADEDRNDDTPGDSCSASRAATTMIDNRRWLRAGFSQVLGCGDCGTTVAAPEPRLFSFNSPLGACPSCEGFGNVLVWDIDRIVPDRTKSLREGAIAPWNSPAYRHEMEELLALAPDYGIPVDRPVSDLTDAQWRVIWEGVTDRDFGGLNGFFGWLERRKYKVPIRVFISRWRSERPCPICHGARLREAALAWRIGGKSIAEISALDMEAARTFFAQLEFVAAEQQVSGSVLEQIRARLTFLCDIGLGYLTLDRPIRTLSGGETHRVALTTALGSSLVNMLYVLDEPSVGLHPIDTDRLLTSLFRLRDRGNSVVVVEHEEAILRAADQVIEVGPGAGEQGGNIVFQGTPAEMAQASECVTGDYLAGRRGRSVPQSRRPGRGAIRLLAARGHNLKNIDVEFPLGLLCVVAGVSGAGKSTLVHDTLYPAICSRKRKETPTGQPYDAVLGDGQIDDVMLVDQSPIGRSPRSNPVTYVKAFDAIRAVFADTLESRTRNLSASDFSFNVDGGRCPTCKGDGYVQIDMQFLSDVMMKCSDCQGERYRREILQVLYRGKSIADVLRMSVREGIRHFRGHDKVQRRLRALSEVGLAYLRLGQPANTLSAGESQRLKLAAFLARGKRSRTLFLLDEPTTGLHFSDIVQLLDCFDSLLEAGHSLIVVEHNLQLMMAADHIIELGPGPSERGGKVVATGTPEDLARHPDSITGKFLSEDLIRFAAP